MSLATLSRETFAPARAFAPTQPLKARTHLYSAMSEARGGPVDLFSVNGGRMFQRSMAVESGFLGAANQTRPCVTPSTWMNTWGREHKADLDATMPGGGTGMCVRLGDNASPNPVLLV